LLFADWAGSSGRVRVFSKSKPRHAFLPWKLGIPSGFFPTRKIKQKEVRKMLVKMKSGARSEQVMRVRDCAERSGLRTRDILSPSGALTIGIVGDDSLCPSGLAALEGVESVERERHPFKLASRQYQQRDTVVRVGDGVCIGGQKVVVIAGPCGIESEDQLLEAAIAAKGAGAKVLRAGLFKPRTSPYGYQGIGLAGLGILERVRDETGMLLETEVLHTDQVKLVEPFVDMMRIGARSMQNFDLLRAAGRSEKPVILKRGISATLNEWLLAAEYILNEGNPGVVLCERGIRTYVTETRNTLDLNCVPLLKSLSHLPVIVDPSHGTGVYSLVAPMSRAAIAAGADGLLVEMHPRPQAALSDKAQQLTPADFAALMAQVRVVAAAVGRSV
jgi:3-deoxy-7-phosphoheptulonate synthase